MRAASVMATCSASFRRRGTWCLVRRQPWLSIRPKRRSNPSLNTSPAPTCRCIRLSELTKSTNAGYRQDFEGRGRQRGAVSDAGLYAGRHQVSDTKNRFLYHPAKPPERIPKRTCLNSPGNRRFLISHCQTHSGPQARRRSAEVRRVTLSPTSSTPIWTAISERRPGRVLDALLLSGEKPGKLSQRRTCLVYVVPRPGTDLTLVVQSHRHRQGLRCQCAYC